MGKKKRARLSADTRLAIGNRVKRVRLAAGYETHLAFAAAINHDTSTIARVELGKVTPTLELLKAIARVCGVKVADLLGDALEEPEPAAAA